MMLVVYLILGVLALPVLYVLIVASTSRERKADRRADREAAEEYAAEVFGERPRSIRELVDLGVYDQDWGEA